MMLHDLDWKMLKGGYRDPYDPRPAVLRLSNGNDVETAWEELWNELHHQGDVGEASYAAIVILVNVYSDGREVDWNLFALAAAIEVERHRLTNPELPDWLRHDYEQAWAKLGELATDTLQSRVDSTMLQAALAVTALAQKDLKLGALIIHLDRSELDEVLEQRCSWDKLYRATDS
jgi:hypothetical protein